MTGQRTEEKNVRSDVDDGEGNGGEIRGLVAGGTTCFVDDNVSQRERQTAAKVVPKSGRSEVWLLRARRNFDDKVSRSERRVIERSKWLPDHDAISHYHPSAMVGMKL